MMAGSSPAAADPSRGELVAVHRALEKLEGPERQLLLLRHQEHHGFEEIGQQLNCSAEEARLRWYRALEHFTEALRNAP